MEIPSILRVGAVKVKLRCHMLNKKWLQTVLLVSGFWAFSNANADAPPYISQNPNNLPIEDVQKFTTAINEIKKYYVENVSDQKLFENAIRGMLAGLDPHSTYLDVDDFADLKSHTNGKFGGLGIEITGEDGYIRVVSPIDDTPAAKAGIKPGDLIVKIDNIPVKDVSLSEAVSKMRGPAGSPVTLTIYRKSEQKIFNQVVTRDIIHIQSVKSKLLEDGYGYIRISQFQEPTITELNKALAQLKKENNNTDLSGLVLDLRNNPGGLLDSAIDVSDDFLDSKRLKGNNLIVFTRGRMQGSQFEAHATPGDLLNGAPIVVLINEGSASGSEIVAGALQDHKRAVIMGTNSFGKGSVQTVLPLDANSGVKLTTALYYTPSGRSIQAKGIKPDVYVELMDVKKLNQDQEDIMSSMSIKEADLENHFSNSTATNANKATGTNNVTATDDNAANEATNKDQQPLAVTDYQLYEALNLLKGLNVVKKSQMTAS